jgi:hypothetical protein
MTLVHGPDLPRVKSRNVIGHSIVIVKAKETKKCLHRDVDDDVLVEFCQL